MGEAHDGGGGIKTVAQILRKESFSNGLGDGRVETGREALRQVGEALRLREPDGREPSPASSAGIVLRPDQLLGLVDGEHADRTGHRGHADADGERIHGDREPRRDARPYIVKGEAPELKRVLTRRTADEVSRMLEGVLAAGGTAEEAQVEGYELAGKTGTAEKAIKGGYSKTDFIASFIGYAPAKDPRLLVAVMVDTRAATSTAARWPRPPSSGSWSSRCRT